MGNVYSTCFQDNAGPRVRDSFHAPLISELDVAREIQSELESRVDVLARRLADKEEELAAEKKSNHALVVGLPAETRGEGKGTTAGSNRYAADALSADSKTGEDGPAGEDEVVALQQQLAAYQARCQELEEQLVRVRSAALGGRSAN